MFPSTTFTRFLRRCTPNPTLHLVRPTRIRRSVPRIQTPKMMFIRPLRARKPCPARVETGACAGEGRFQAVEAWSFVVVFVFFETLSCE